MDRRIYIPLLAAAALVVAGVGRPWWTAARTRAGTDAPATFAERHERALERAAARRGAQARHRAAAADTVDAGLAVWSDGGTARFALAVVNTADRRVEVNFPDGRTRDFAVYDAAGREVWRWSRGRLFTQVMQNRLLAARDSAVYAEAWTAPRPGRYTVVAELRSANHPLTRAAAFVVPAPIPAGAVAAAGAPAAATP
jgi:hypothetical protein